MPRSLIWSPRATGSPSKGANSRSHDNRTFTGCPPAAAPRAGRSRSPSVHSCELLQEAHVVGVELTDVVHAVAHQGQPVDAEPEGEPAPLLGVVAHGPEHVGVDHAAAAQLQPARLAAGATPPALA